MFLGEKKNKKEVFKFTHFSFFLGGGEGGKEALKPQFNHFCVFWVRKGPEAQIYPISEGSAENKGLKIQIYPFLSAPVEK